MCRVDAIIKAGSDLNTKRCVQSWDCYFCTNMLYLNQAGNETIINEETQF